ncbi:hypothetical protein H8D85_02015 [bacterium]|nr:hypothetical protein [bacterium]
MENKLKKKKNVAVEPYELYKTEVETRYKNTKHELEAYETSFMVSTLAKQFDDMIMQQDESTVFTLN